MIYRHLKTGNRYRLLAEGRDCTNSRDGLKVAIYCREGEDLPRFVREWEEFHEKFQMAE